MFEVVFYRTANGSDIVLDFIKSFDSDDGRTIGVDLYAVQIGFPMGLPLCDHLEGPLWEVRTSLLSNREVRLLFFQKSDKLIVVHGFIKKVQRMPRKDIALAIKQMKEFE